MVQYYSDQTQNILNSLIYMIGNELDNAKGQLISKCPLGVIVSTKIPMKKFDNFCPGI